MMKALAVLGTRPEAIKMAPVVKGLSAVPWIDLRVVVTAQHREMLDQVLDEFDIRSDYDLDLMTPGQSLSLLTSSCIAALDRVVVGEKPDLIIAQGDTTTTFVAALVAFYNRAEFAHLEAGLRTNDLQNPFPEELNRQIATKIASLHFAPTPEAAENLLREGVEPERITVTGNTVIDALMMVSRPPSRDVTRQPRTKMLVTVHRRENFGAPLTRIVSALKLLLSAEPALTITWPVHPNPQVDGHVREAFRHHSRVRLLPPMSYGDFIRAMAQSDFVLTDSGGVQEEAPALSRPVLVLRNETERPEAVAAGVARLVGTDVGTICQAVSELMHDPEAYAAMITGNSPYGDGNATKRVLAAISASYEHKAQAVEHLP